MQDEGGGRLPDPPSVGWKSRRGRRMGCLWGGRFRRSAWWKLIRRRVPTDPLPVGDRRNGGRHVCIRGVSGFGLVVEALN